MVGNKSFEKALRSYEAALRGLQSFFLHLNKFLQIGWVLIPVEVLENHRIEVGLVFGQIKFSIR